MLTSFRSTGAQLLSVAFATCFIAMGCSDTAQGQTLTVSNANLSFSAAQGSNPSPPTQQVSVGSTGAAISYLISTDQKWLLASTGAFGGSGGTSGIDPITIQINSISLNSGTYTGIVTLSPTNGSAKATITITLTISGSGPATSTLTASLAQLNFAFEVGKTGPPSQGVQISSTGINLPITSVSVNTAPTNNCPSSWLQAGPATGTTPATITVSIVTTGLNPGACTGAIAVSSTSTGNGTTSVTIGVTLFISQSPVLNVGIPAGLTSVTLQQNGPRVQFPISLTSSDPAIAIPFTAGTAPGADNQWLAVSPVSGNTPASMNVEFFPGGALPAGIYNGSIIVTSSGLFNGSTTIPISFNLTSGSGVSVSPSGSLNFNEAQGGAVPPSQVLTLTGASSTNFTTTVTQQSGGLWLQASPTSGSITGGTPGSVTLTVLPTNPPLGQGTYSCLVTISFQSNGLQPIVIPVSLTVGPPASALVVSPSSLTFSYVGGGTVPPAQTISVTNPAAGSLAYTVGSITQSWLNVTPSGGNTPGTVSVSVAPQGLLPGTYTGSFSLSASGAAPSTITVTMNITQTTTPQIFIIGNAASGVGGELAPGEIITIKGSQLGPATPVQFTVGSLTQPTLGGVGVTFSGYPGTLLYVSASQINVTVPYEVAGMSSTLVVVNYNGGSSSGVTQPVGAASLGLFTANSTGSGQASILNQNYTVNSPSNPASQASYISVYATGGGQTSPASFDGEVSPTASLLPLVLQSAVTATIAGRNAPVVFAGAAPGFVTGLVQFNLQIPPGTTGTALPIVISINGAAVVQSQSGATVSVQ